MALKVTQHGAEVGQSGHQGVQTQHFYTCAGRFPAIATIKDIGPCTKIRAWPGIRYTQKVTMYKIPTPLFQSLIFVHAVYKNPASKKQGRNFVHGHFPRVQNSGLIILCPEFCTRPLWACTKIRFIKIQHTKKPEFLDF